jgi:hypothetical protein
VPVVEATDETVGAAGALKSVIGAVLVGAALAPNELVAVTEKV